MSCTERLVEGGRGEGLGYMQCAQGVTWGARTPQRGGPLQAHAEAAGGGAGAMALHAGAAARWRHIAHPRLRPKHDCQGIRQV